MAVGGARFLPGGFFVKGMRDLGRVTAEKGRQETSRETRFRQNQKSPVNIEAAQTRCSPPHKKFRPADRRCSPVEKSAPETEGPRDARADTWRPAAIACAMPITSSKVNASCLLLPITMIGNTTVSRPKTRCNFIPRTNVAVDPAFDQKNLDAS